MSLRALIPGGITSLLTFFGITPRGNEDVSFELSGVVVPTAIVGSLTTLQATSTPMLLGTPFTNGDQVAPAANTVLADTGAQAAGTYQLRIQFNESAAANNTVSLLIQRRNAANAANIWQERVMITNTAGYAPFGELNLYVTLADQERIRVITEVGSAAASVVSASIWANRLT